MPASTLPLHIWLSPAFPVGSFAYSHGLEWAVEAGQIKDAASLLMWLEDLVSHGAIRNDAILACLALRAAKRNELAALQELNDLALALAGGRERYLETSSQGSAFVTAALAAWPCGVLAGFRNAQVGPVAYPVAFGMTAGGHDLPLLPCLEAFALAFAAMLVSAAVRLGPIGQTDGQRVTAALLPLLQHLARKAETAELDDLGTCAWRSDLAAMHHETQYSRLFRT